MLSLDIFPDDGAASDQEHLVPLQNAWLKLGHAKMLAEQVYEFTDELSGDVCETLGDSEKCIGAGPAVVCLPNPGYYICRIVKLVTKAVGYALQFAFTIAYHAIDDQYEIATMSDKEAYYGFFYSRATYHNTFEYGKKNWKALVEIRTDMMNQHTEMKRQLQERHKDIANHVGQDVSDLN